MKSNNTTFIKLDFLPNKSIGAFAKSYKMSFPELKLTESELMDFLNRKFQILENTDSHNIAALITNDGVVASGYGIVRNSYSQGVQSINVGLVCDVFTNANFRKMGLFKKVSLLAIEREQFASTSFLIGFPIRDEVMPGHLSVGWKYLFDMPLWWSLPRIGSSRNVTKNPDMSAIMFDPPKKDIAIKVTDEFLKWRFSLFKVDYYLISIPDSRDFAIVRKSKLKNIPFTCIVFFQSTNNQNARILVRKIRNLSFRLGTVGIIGCWNNSYAEDLNLKSSGMRRSSMSQKVIVRELNNFRCPSEEKSYRLSWMDSDTL
jgi:hypothetical protein